MTLPTRLALSLLLAAFFLAACGGPPQALTEQEVPAAMAKAFAGASPALKNLADQAVQSLRDRQYAKALMEFQNICAIHELNKEQRTVASRSLLTVTESLRTARDQGDSSAEKLIRFHELNK